MKWIGELIVAILKAIFGTDKPTEITVDDKPSGVPPTKTDDELLDDLGIKRNDTGGEPG